MATGMVERTVGGVALERVLVKRVFGGWYAIVRTVDGRSRAMVEGPVTSEARAWAWVEGQLDRRPS